MEDNPIAIKQFVLSKLGKMHDQARGVIEKTPLDCFISSPLRYRNPLEILWGISTKTMFVLLVMHSIP